MAAGRVRFGTFPPQYTKDAATGELKGPLVEVMRELGAHMRLPVVFTEVANPAEVNITIMRAFVKLRQLLESNEELNRKFAAVIRKLSTHDKYFKVVFDELKKLTEQPSASRKQIGFKSSNQS